MSDKKNIDRLFQEKFKDFEVSPGKSVWGRIEAELDSNTKKEKKILPIWWKLGAAAAILALLISIGYNNTYKREDNNTITNIQSDSLQKNIDIKNKEKLNDVVENSHELESNIGRTNSEASINKTTSNSHITASNSKNHEKTKTNFNRIKNNNENNTTTTNPITIQNDKNSSQKINSVVVNNTTKRENVTEAKNNTIKKEKDPILKNKSSSEKAEKVIVKNDEGKPLIEVVEEQQNNENVSQKINSSVVKNNTIKEEKDPTLKNKSSSEKVDEVIVKDEKNKDGKKSLLEVVEEQQKEKKELVEATHYNKWSVNPNVAPVYYNTIGSGSPINSQFSDNNKEGAINMSYGINVAYQINNKLSIRSGINKVDYGYNTQGIEFTSSTRGDAIGTVNYSARAKNIKVTDNVIRSTSDQSNSPALDAFNSLEVLGNSSAIDTYEGSMNQQFGYLEIPLELKYRVINKKFGINIIGGLSSLFLTKNQITLESDSLITEIGEANNISNTNFSTNVGLGFDYLFTKNIQFNVEPMFKYQLNAFSNNDGGFKPYSLGIYTGLNFKF